MEIRCPSCNRKAGDTDENSYVKITCQRCFTDFSITKGVYKIIPTKSSSQLLKQERYEAKKRMSQSSYQTRLGIRKKNNK